MNKCDILPGRSIEISQINNHGLRIDANRMDTLPKDGCLTESEVRRAGRRDFYTFVTRPFTSDQENINDLVSVTPTFLGGGLAWTISSALWDAELISSTVSSVLTGIGATVSSVVSGFVEEAITGSLETSPLSMVASIGMNSLETGVAAYAGTYTAATAVVSLITLDVVATIVIPETVATAVAFTVGLAVGVGVFYGAKKISHFIFNQGIDLASEISS